jgi:long-chain fatty acid transport protein
MFAVRRPIRLLFFLTLLAALSPALSWAGGFYSAPANAVYNVGPEAAWMNPAGMTGVKTASIAASVGGFLPISRVDASVAEAGDEGGNTGVSGVLPSFYAVVPATDDLRFGFSMLSPFGAVNGSGLDYGDEFVGRYATISAELATIAFGPSIAYRVIDGLSIGAGAVAQHAVFDQTIALNTPLFPGDGQARLDGLDGWSGMFYGGLHYQISPQTSVGVVYRSKQDIELSGDVVFSNLPVQLPNAKFDLEWENPQSVQVGIQHVITPAWIVRLDFAWEDWSAFSQNQVTASFANGVAVTATLDRNWKDSYSGGAALTHISGANVFSAGLAYTSSVVEDEDRTIDLPVDESLVVSFSAARNENQNLSYGVGASVLINGDASVDQTAQGVRFAGDFSPNLAVIIGGSIQWRF